MVVNCVGFSLAYLSEAHCRDNFARLQRLGEEERVKVSLRDSVHRLLLNTLPAPIAHRYGEVTVLQADLSGFTKLSSERSAAFVIGLLSDLFAKFDRLTEWHGVHKVKTIGDAYVAIGGAFNDKLMEDKKEAARRMVESSASPTHQPTSCPPANQLPTCPAHHHWRTCPRSSLASRWWTWCAARRPRRMSMWAYASAYTRVLSPAP